VVPRLLLDHWLFEHARRAGVRSLEDANLIGYSVGADSVQLDLQKGGQRVQLTTKLLIGADGSSSKVGRQLRGRSGRSEDRIIAVRAYYSGVNVVPGRAELYFSSSSFPGYYWFFPTSKRTANVGVGMVGETIPPGVDHLRELLLELSRTDPALGKRLAGARLEGSIRGWPLSTYNPAEAAVGERVLLVGDAAGLINPLNGEGIQYALLSGRWAAETALECLNSNDFDVARLHAYDQRLKDNLRYDMALAQMIVQLIRNRDLNPVWLASLRIITQRAKKDTEYARLAGGILAGLVPARHAVGPRILRGTVLEALASLARGAISTSRRPDRLMSLGVGAVGVGFRLAFDTAENPSRTFRWGQAVATSALELGAQVVRDLGRPEARAPLA
jgi:flavin-dependent dehydrogenase